MMVGGETQLTRQMPLNQPYKATGSVISALLHPLCLYLIWEPLAITFPHGHRHPNSFIFTRTCVSWLNGNLRIPLWLSLLSCPGPFAQPLVLIRNRQHLRELLAKLWGSALSDVPEFKVWLFETAFLKRCWMGTGLLSVWVSAQAPRHSGEPRKGPEVQSPLASPIQWLETPTKF